MCREKTAEGGAINVVITEFCFQMTVNMQNISGWLKKNKKYGWNF
jgi:hypothetical protein